MVMQQNVTQKTTSEFLNTSRSPKAQKYRIKMVCSGSTCCKNTIIAFLSVPSGVKKTMEATRKPSIRPTTTTQAMTEPKRHQLITSKTPPTTPTTPDRVRRTAETRDRVSDQGPVLWHVCANRSKLTIVVQVRGPGDEDEEEKGQKAEPHAEQFWRGAEMFLFLSTNQTSTSEQLDHGRRPTRLYFSYTTFCFYMNGLPECCGKRVRMFPL